MPDSFRRANTVNVYGLVFLAIALLPVRLSAQTVATYDFEGGSANGWTSFFGASAPVASSGASFTGSESLLTAASASGTGGPSIALDSVLLPGAQYTITAWVRLTSGESASNANFTMKRSDPSLLPEEHAMTLLEITRSRLLTRVGRRSAELIHLQLLKRGFCSMLNSSTPPAHNPSISMT